MPAGEIEVLEKVMTSIAETIDDFVILSVHDDVDILVPKDHKPVVIEILESFGFEGHVNGSPKCLYYAEPPIQYYDSNKCHIDLQTGLYYKGIEPNILVPIDIKFQEYAYSTRVKTNDTWRYRLSPESNVVHPTCRMIFDKRQEDTPPHYRKRLEKALNLSNKSELKLVFDMALFKFGEKALELVTKGELDNLFQEYISYGDY